MIARLARLFAPLLLVPLLGAGESPPPEPLAATVIVDGSRSTGDDAFRDRLALFTDTFLARRGGRALTVVTGAAAPAERVGDLPWTSRASNYLLAFQQAVRPLLGDQAGKLVVLVGDGRIEVIGDATEPPAGFMPEGVDNPTRVDLNQAALARLQREHATDIADRRLAWLVVETARPDRPAPVFDWMASQRPDLRRIDSEALTLALMERVLTEAGRPAPGRPLTGDSGGAVILIEPGVTLVSVPEGCTGLRIALNALDGNGAYRVVVREQGGAELGSRLQAVDPDGPARFWTASGLDAGGNLEILVDAAEGAFELEVHADVALQHRMALRKGAEFVDLFPGDEAELEHTFSRADGRAVSDPTATALRADLELSLDGAPLPLAPAAPLVLPDAGEHTLAATFTRPEVASQPLVFTIAAATDLILRGGFADDGIWEDSTVDLAFEARGGRRHLSEIAVVVIGPDDSRETVTLAPDSDNPRVFRAALERSSSQRGTWRIDPEALPDGASGRLEIATVAGDEAAGVGQRYGEVVVSWDWRLAALLALILLLCLLGLLLWWWLTRPRLGSEILVHEGQDVGLAALPGPVARHTSWGLAAFGKALLFTKGRTGVTVERRDKACRLFLNGRPVEATSVGIVPGNDLELVTADGQRVHARFFASTAERKGWTPEQAQIDLDRDFSSPHFVLEG